MRKIVVILFLFVFGFSVSAAKDQCYETDSIASLPIRQQLAAVDWKRVGITLSMRIALKVAIDATLKECVDEWRPDGSNDHSFPSRHSSWAYGIAGTIAYELGVYSPFWVVGAQAVANGVGFQRVLSRRHWPRDVLAGATIGIGVDIFTKAIGNWIFGTDNKYACWAQTYNELLPSIYVSTGATLPLGDRFGDYKLCTALASNVRFVMPLHEKFGVSMDFSLVSAPIKELDVNRYPLTSLGVMAGAAFHQDFDGPFAITAFVEGGYMRNFKVKEIDINAGSICMLASVQGSMTIRDKLAIGMEAGYGLRSLRLGNASHPLSSCTIGLFTRASF